MSYAIAGLAAVIAMLLLYLGYWRYLAVSFVLFAAISIPFVFKARKISNKKNRLRMAFGTLLLLVLFVVVMFAAAIAINFSFWYIFKQH